MKKNISLVLSVALILSSVVGFAPACFANPSYSHTVFGNIRIEENNGEIGRASCRERVYVLV